MKHSPIVTRNSQYGASRGPVNPLCQLNSRRDGTDNLPVADREASFAELD
jgi:hypothetical protein